MRITWCEECEDGKCHMFMILKPCGKLAWKSDCGHYRDIAYGNTKQEVELAERLEELLGEIK